ncbi:MAG TPA: hypothetical protein VEI06_16065 [Gemmatimonadaceae bacterium]|nr:hypothetical protein [Gemmatimonadaceae bacterium]
MKRLRILTLVIPEHLPPETLDGYTDQQILEWRAEYDVVRCLERLGHEVYPLAVQEDLEPIRQAVETKAPHLVFNMLEEFQKKSDYDQHVVSFLELLGVPYTGCNPRGLVLSRGKALSKKLLAYHSIPVPRFEVYPIGKRIKLPDHLEFPLFVKSLTEHASYGIAKASLVDNEDQLRERVEFIHASIHTDAIAEEFIDGRELYVSVVGNDRLQTFPTWELVIDGESEPLIATAKVKHDLSYQVKKGVRLQPATDIPKEVEAQIGWLSKRIYRVLEMSGYARIDYRLDKEGQLYFLDANPNPDICETEEFASAAKQAGLTYDELIQRILNLGLRAAS